MSLKTVEFGMFIKTFDQTLFQFLKIAGQETIPFAMSVNKVKTDSGIFPCLCSKTRSKDGLTRNNFDWRAQYGPMVVAYIATIRRRMQAEIVLI